MQLLVELKKSKVKNVKQQDWKSARVENILIFLDSKEKHRNWKRERQNKTFHLQGIQRETRNRAYYGLNFAVFNKWYISFWIVLTISARKFARQGIFIMTLSNTEFSMKKIKAVCVLFFIEPCIKIYIPLLTKCLVNMLPNFQKKVGSYHVLCSP